MYNKDAKNYPATTNLLSFEAHKNSRTKEAELDNQKYNETLAVIQDFAQVKSQRRREIIMTTLRMFRMLEETENANVHDADIIKHHQNFTRRELKKGLELIDQFKSDMD